MEFQFKLFFKQKFDFFSIEFGPRFFGMVFVHVHSFELGVRELTTPGEEEDGEARVRRLRRQYTRQQSLLSELGDHKEWDTNTDE